MLAHVGHVGIDVQSEAVHRAAVGQAYTDGTDLALAVGVGVQPHTGVAGQSTRTAHTQLLQRVDHQLLDIAHVIGGPESVVHVQNGISHQLARAVIGDVAAPFDGHEVGAHRRRIALQVGREIGSRSVGEDVRMLLEQQVLLAPVVEDGRLQSQSLAIRHPSQPTDAQHV